MSSYQINVFDIRTLRFIAILDNASISEMQYSSTVNGIGAFALTVDADQLPSAALEVDTLYIVKRKKDFNSALLTWGVYLLRQASQYVEADSTQRKITIGAVSAEHLFTRRVVDPANDPLVAGGYSTKDGSTDIVLSEYILQQAGAGAEPLRTFPRLVVNNPTGDGIPMGARLRYENLWDFVRENAEKARQYIRFVFDDNNEFRVTVAGYVDKPRVVISPERGSATNPVFSLDRTSERNYVILLGQGQGSNRQELRDFSAATNDSPYNRLEFTSDARNADKSSLQQLITEGQNALYDARAIPSFAVKFVFGNGIGYPEDVQLGDVVTAYWQEINVTRRLLVRGLNVTVSTNSEDIELQLEAIDL
jgi:hypothetical protein